MRQILCFFAMLLTCSTLSAQLMFDEQIQVPAGYAPEEFVMPPSPLSTQVLFIGGVDMVQAPATYGNPAGPTPAKEWHDFIGFTPDQTGQSLGWVSINHEMVFRDDRLGDGGGMTVFRVERNADGTLDVVDQTLSDGRSGKFFGVDFANTVGETGMNCGGITSLADGRIWTAEEWFRGSNASINNGVFRSPGSTSWFPQAPGTPENQGVRDTADFVVSSDIPGWDGRTLKKYENFNWMVEIDPREAVAIRKQYNWGRQPFEGGVIDRSNKIVYLGPDATPGFFGMFVAATPGDFNKGTLFAYKHDKPGYNWVPIWEDGFELNHQDLAVQKGATMFNRIEWVAMDGLNNVYFTETGRDNPGSRWADENAAGAVHHPYHIQRAQSLGLSSPNDAAYPDYYGRIWKYDPVRDEVSVYLEAGPFFADSPDEANYPDVHLSNPDGLNVMKIGGRDFLVICEDLNGTSFGRTPAGVSNRTCEMFLLDLAIDNPTLNDLIRLAVVPTGAEITGAQATSDGKSLLVNVQHPNSTNPFPYNHSLTIAINGFDKLTASNIANYNVADELTVQEEGESQDAFKIYPNPTTRMVFFNQTTDVAIYNAEGKRVSVKRNANQVDVSHLTPGMYFLQNADGEILKLSVQ